MCESEQINDQSIWERLWDISSVRTVSIFDKVEWFDPFKKKVIWVGTSPCLYFLCHFFSILYVWSYTAKRYTFQGDFSCNKVLSNKVLCFNSLNAPEPTQSCHFSTCTSLNLLVPVHNKTYCNLGKTDIHHHKVVNKSHMNGLLKKLA